MTEIEQLETKLKQRLNSMLKDYSAVKKLFQEGRNFDAIIEIQNQTQFSMCMCKSILNSIQTLENRQRTN